MCGTIRLEAVVVRNLFSMFNVDCVASTKTYTRLTGKEPPDDPPMDLSDDEENDEDIPGLDDSIDEMPDPVTTKQDPPDPGDSDDHDDKLVEVWNTDPLPEDFVADVVIANRPYPHQPTYYQPADDQECDQDQELFCNICYHSGQPVTVALSHRTLDLACPMLTPEEKDKIRNHRMTGSQGDRFLGS